MGAKSKGEYVIPLRFDFAEPCSATLNTNGCAILRQIFEGR
jgi:hypothetical protein